jgi:TIR domain
MMCEIFISHIHEDEQAANAISNFLSKRLNTAWISTQPVKERVGLFLSENQFQVRLGEDWLQKIHSALNSSKVVIALFSQGALTRPWVHFEAGGAWFAGKALIPVCLGGVDPARLPKPYSNIQGCNLHKDGSPYYLFQSIWTVLRPSTIVPPPLPDEDERTLQESLVKWRVDDSKKP